MQSFNGQARMVCWLACFAMLQGCTMGFQPGNRQAHQVEKADRLVSDAQLQPEVLAALDYNAFSNNDPIDAFEATQNEVYRLTLGSVGSEPLTVVVQHHYFNAVGILSEGSNHINWIRQNQYKPQRRYSTHLIAFDLPIPDSQLAGIHYLVVKNVVPSEIAFFVEPTTLVIQYDKKLTTVFTAVYAAVITLIMVNLVFFVFIKQRSYLYYALYTGSMLISLLYLEGAIAYFEQLSKPFLGIYTIAFMTSFPSIFFLLFVIHFIGKKNMAAWDLRACQSLMWLMGCVMLACVVMYHSAADGFYPVLIMAFNALLAGAALLVMSVSVKYSIQGNRQAKFLAGAWLIFMVSVCLRIYSTFNPDPLHFWTVRFMEFGFLAESLILSFGLADRTAQYMKQRDRALFRISQADRALYAREVIQTFHSKASQAINQHVGSNRQLEGLIHSYLLASVEQIMDESVSAAYVLCEDNGQIGIIPMGPQSTPMGTQNWVVAQTQLIRQTMQQAELSLAAWQQDGSSAGGAILIPVKPIDQAPLCMLLFGSGPNFNQTDIAQLTCSDDLKKLSLAYAEVLTIQAINHESKTDALTQAFNRKAIEQRLEHILAGSQSTIAVAFIDVDDFKSINDQHGHAVGDDCLIFLCQNMKYQFKSAASVGRLGGDEFVVVFSNGMADRVVKKIQGLYQLLAKHKVHNLQLSISMGVAVADLRHHKFSRTELLKRADELLYQAKQRGKNTFCVDAMSSQ